MLLKIINLFITYVCDFGLPPTTIGTIARKRHITGTEQIKILTGWVGIFTKKLKKINKAYNINLLSPKSIIMFTYPFSLFTYVT